MSRQLSTIVPYLMAVALATDVHAQQATAPPAPRPISFIARNTTRVEMWSFFEPGGAADPDYAHIGNRLFLGVEGHRPHGRKRPRAEFANDAGLLGYPTET